MTYTDKIRKQSLNLLQIQNDLKQMLDSRDWTSHFCHCSEDHMQCYTESLSRLKKQVHLSEIGYMSTVFSEDLALMLIKSCLEDNISHIAKFLISEETSIELMGMMTDMSVGYIVNRDRSVQEVSTVIISIRKNDKPCQNSSGFMVEYISRKIIMNNFIRKVIVFLIVIVETLGVSCVTDDYGFKQELLSGINYQREIAGLNDLILSSDLSEAAKIRAKEAADKWSHIRPDGTKFDVLISKLDWEVAGENLAKCSDNTDCKTVVQTWMNSKLHRINIVNSRFKQCGIGIYKLNDMVYIALLFTN